MNAGYNPDFNPTGIEGGIDTHLVPWIPLPYARGLSVKPLRASAESGMFTAIVRLERGAALPEMVHLGAMDMTLLSGSLVYPDGPLAGTWPAGTWGYVPANARVSGLSAAEDVEFLANFYGPVAFLEPDGHSVSAILTSLDLIAAARARGIALVPNTLAECMLARPSAWTGAATPLAIAEDATRRSLLAVVPKAAARATHPHFVDTRAVPWAVNPKEPDFGLKILRVSEETGYVSMIVKHNGVAGPHYHLAAADFLILSGRIGYRLGPPEGYGPGVWFYEPAGARHDATQRLSDDDLIYTANVYGPLQFDTGRGTPIAAVVSWMQYKKMADAAGATLVRNAFADDTSWLAWAPLGARAAAL